MQILTQETLVSKPKHNFKMVTFVIYPCNKKNVLKGTPYLVPRKLIGGVIRGVNL